MKLFIKILLLVLWIGLAAGSAVLMGFANLHHEVKMCTGVEIIIDQSKSDPLFTPSDLKLQLTDTYGKFERKKLHDIDLESIQLFLQNNPYVESANARTTIEGRLVIEISQCNPLARLITPGGENYYLDTHGKILPVDPAHPVRVIIANGAVEMPLKAGNSIFSKESKKQVPPEVLQTLLNIHSISLQLRADSVLNALVEQIYVKPGGDLQLFTKAGSHIIEFGDSNNSPEKLANLKTFYKFGLSKTGWTRYKIINLKFKNQVVCTK